MNSLLASKNVVLTGGTGFIGLRLVSKLLNSTSTKKVAIAVRGSGRAAASRRFEELVRKHSCLGIGRHFDRVEIRDYNGRDIPLDTEDDALLNLAADTCWMKGIDEMMAANHEPLKRLLDDSLLPEHVLHCSTAYAVPLEHVNYGNATEEERFPHGTTFFSPYGESKYHCERLIEANKTKAKFTIVRPGAVGADSGSDGQVPLGWATNMKSINGLYYVTHPLSPFSEIKDKSPVAAMCSSNAIPVDFVANTIILSLYRSVVDTADDGISYVHAAPHYTNDITWGELIRTYNPSVFLQDLGPCDFGDTRSNKYLAGMEVLFKCGGKPFAFHANKKQDELQSYLAGHEAKIFPTDWNCSDKKEATKHYVRKCSAIVGKILQDRISSNQSSAVATKGSTRSPVHAFT